jgi:predicted esterase
MATSKWRQWGGAPANEGRLTSRLTSPSETAASGLHQLGFGSGRDGLLYVPASYSQDRPAPFVLSFHGAGGNEQGGLWPFQEHADAEGLVVLAVASRGPTWDVIRGGYGQDVEFIDRALSFAFARCAVDPTRLAVGGFSDGASYALSVGLTNGDLFTHIVAFSPGFAAPADEVGKPRVYVSHGVNDEVLPIDRCSRRLVPMIRNAGYDVRYREFDGPHTIPPEIAREALDWFR